MALVSYGSSDEGSDLGSDREEEEEKSTPQQPVTKKSLSPVQPPPQNSNNGGVKADIHISDDEDESGGPRGFEDFDEDEEPEEFRSSSIFASLRPAGAVIESSENEGSKAEELVDTNEDLSTIPAAKTYSEEGSSTADNGLENDSEADSDKPAKPVSRWSNQARKARKEGRLAGSSTHSTSVTGASKHNGVSGTGKKKILAPNMLEGVDSDDDGEGGVKGPVLPTAKRARGPGDQASHSLFSVLPKPSNDSSYRPAAQPSRSTFTKAPSLPSVTSIKSTTTTSGGGGVTSMMPRTVKKPASSTPTVSASSSSKRSVVEQSGAEDEDAPFFSFTDSSREKMDRELPKLPQNAMKSLASVRVNANPDATAPMDRPLEGLAARPSSSRLSEPSVYGPSMGAPEDRQGGGYDDANDLMANRDQIERLQGRMKGKRGQMMDEIANIVDVNQSDLTAEPLEWMKQTLKEDAEAPGPRNTIKGQTKRKHQITYLAAMAKEKEQELKQKWSENAQARRAAGNKYGF